MVEKHRGIVDTQRKLALPIQEGAWIRNAMLVDVHHLPEGEETRAAFKNEMLRRWPRNQLKVCDESFNISIHFRDS